MDQAYWTPRSFYPNAPPSPPPRNSSLALTLPYQHAVPAQRVQQQQSVARPTYGASNLGYRTVVPDPFAQSPSYFSGPSIHTTPRSPWSQDLSRDASVGLQSPSAATSNDHDHWCYLCEDHKNFKTRDSLNRHMREKHYTKYYCIPEDSIRDTEDGPSCAFCGALNPDPRHLNTHNVPRCVNKTYSRKLFLIRHLKDEHHVCDSSTLADRSKYTVNQKYFACGFCVFCCDSLNAQINHIDVRHYKNSEHICEWEDDNVIRGLLSQPVVNEYWRSFLAANPHLQQSGFMWDRTHAKPLRHRLEISREPAHILLQAVINQSNYGISQHSHSELVPVTASMEEGMVSSHPTQTFQRGIVLSPLPLTIEQGLATPQMTAPILQSQHLPQDWDGLDNSDWSTDYDGQPSPQIASEAYNSPPGTKYHHADHLTRPYVMRDNGENFAQHQRPPCVFSKTPASYTSQAVECQAGILHYSTLGGHSPSAPRDVAAHPGSRQVVGTHPLPAQAHAGWSHPTLGTQSTSAPFLSHRQTSPLGHLNGAYSPHHPTLGVHFSSRETRDSLGMDTDSDFDDQPRGFMQYQNRSQRRRRNR